MVGHHRTVAELGTEAGVAIGRHLDSAFRAMLRDDRSTHEPRFLRLLTGEPHPFGNFAVLSAPVSLDAAREAVEPLAASAAPAAVLFPGLFVPGEIDAYLSERGFAAHGAMPAMAVDIASLTPTTLPDGYELVRVGEGPDALEWVRQFAVGYELPPGVAACFSPVAALRSASPATMQSFAVRRHGRIVCTSMCYLDEGLAGIYCVATIPEERRKGLGAHATAEPLRMMAREGYRVGVLQSSEAGHGVYRHLGFAEFGGVPLYVRIPNVPNGVRS